MKFLPHGDVGRIINSFLYEHHQDAIQWQRDFRYSLYIKRNSLSFLEQLHEPIHLVAIKHFSLKYQHVIRLPDYRRIIPLIDNITRLERITVNNGGIPSSWYPQISLPRIIHSYNGSPVGTNTYIVETPDPLPWNCCTHKNCCPLST